VEFLPAFQFNNARILSPSSKPCTLRAQLRGQGVVAVRTISCHVFGKALQIDSDA
jgi:hypothetical protein